MNTFIVGQSVKVTNADKYGSPSFIIGRTGTIDADMGGGVYRVSFPITLDCEDDTLTYPMHESELK